MSKLSLDERIAAAFTEDATSDIVSKLVVEAQTAAKVFDEAAQEAKRGALDPRLSKSKCDAARARLVDAEFDRDRMNSAVVQLTKRLTEVKALDEDWKRRLAYDRAEAVRDKLAAELRELYPAFAERLIRLFVLIEANDQEIQFINKERLPRRCERLLGAEAVARGLPGYIDGTRDIPRISQQLRLPAFEYSREQPYIWS